MLEMTDIEKEIRESGHYDTMPNGVAIVSNTFMSDFTIAKRLSGVDGIKETYKRSFESFKDDIRYLTAMVLALNHCGHYYYDLGEKDVAKVFFDLQFELDGYILHSKGYGKDWKPTNFTQEEVSYYLAATD